MITTFSVTLIAVAAQVTAPAPTQVWGMPLEGIEAEEFLSTAEIEELKRFDTKGVTRPRRAVLSDGELTARAIFKDIDEFAPIKKLEGGTVMQFRDSYKNDIAAYELDKLLGLGVVPPCVERRIKGDTGCLCLWVEGTMTEWERLKVEKLQPPDAMAWNDRKQTIKLFQQLIADMDYKNVSNLLVDPDFKIYKVDSSRAFRTDKKLRDEESLVRFSRPLLEALQGLERDEAVNVLKPWLSKSQIDALLQRRDAVLELAERRIAERGEEAVLFD